MEAKQKAEEFLLNYKPILDDEFLINKLKYGFELALSIQVSKAYHESRVNDVSDEESLNNRKEQGYPMTYKKRQLYKLGFEDCKNKLLKK